MNNADKLQIAKRSRDIALGLRRGAQAIVHAGAVLAAAAMPSPGKGMQRSHVPAAVDPSP